MLHRCGTNIALMLHTNIVSEHLLYSSTCGDGNPSSSYRYHV